MGRQIGRHHSGSPITGGAGGGAAGGGSGPAKREPLTRSQMRVLLGLYIGYSSMIFSKAALDVAIPLILEDTDMAMGSTDVGRLLTLCSASYLLGKLSTGYSVDRLGAKFVFLWLASFTSAALTGLVSLCNDSYRLTLIVCIVFIAQSSGWSALTSLVSSWLHPSQYGFAFGFLSTSSRMGDVASKVILGRIASWGYGWRSLFLVAAGLQMLTAAFNQAFIPRSPLTPPDHPRSPTAAATGPVSGAGADMYISNGGINSEVEEASSSGKARRPPNTMMLEKASLSQHLWQTVMTDRFCYIAVGLACLHVVMEFDKYMPLYIHKSLAIGPGMAAQAAALYPLSQFVALVLAGLAYDRLSPVGKLVTVSGLSFLVFFFYTLQCVFKMYAVAVADWLYLLLIFMAGFCLAVPYYLPASIFIVELGGKKHCGTLSGLLDASGGLAAIIFHSTVGALVSQDKWITLLGILSAAAFLGFLAITAFQRQTLLVTSGPSKLDVSSLRLAGGTGTSASGAGDLRSRKARSSFAEGASEDGGVTMSLLPHSCSSSALSMCSNRSTGAQAGAVSKRVSMPTQEFLC